MQRENKDQKKSQIFPINCHYCTPIGKVKGKLNLYEVNSLFFVLMFIPMEKDANNQEVYKNINGKF
jgi:hypothetical protein